MAQLLPTGRQYYTDTATGLPLAGGKVWTYAAGTSTPKATYTSAAATTANTNPVILDARGWVPYPIPSEVSLHTRMHLNREQVAALLPTLQRFVETGEI